MQVRVSMAIAAAFVVSACGAGSGGAERGTDGSAGGASAIDCAPLSVKINGEPVAGLDFALALSESGAFGVEAFNHSDVNCDDLLAGSRSVPPGEIDVRAYVGGGMDSVSVGFRTQFAQGLELIRTPEKEGDTVAICVPVVTWTSGDGEHTYEIAGLFMGPYCGERSLR